jgi:hypothetical protein
MWRFQPVIGCSEIIAVFQMPAGDDARSEEISVERDRTPLGAGPREYG